MRVWREVRHDLGAVAAGGGCRGAAGEHGDRTLRLSAEYLLEVPRFNCGHERCAPNIVVNSFNLRGKWVDQERCRICHNLANAKYRRKMRRKGRK